MGSGTGGGGGSQGRLGLLHARMFTVQAFRKGTQKGGRVMAGSVEVEKIGEKEDSTKRKK